MEYRRVRDGYRLIGGAPSVPDYVRLRREAGLGLKTESQAAAVLLRRLTCK